MSDGARPKIAMVAPTLNILGGQAVQATLLAQQLRSAGHDVEYVPIDPPLPTLIEWMKGFRYLRTVVNEALYLPALLRLRAADVVHVYSASYWSFVLAPLPAVLMARCLGKPVVLNYHSGEAADHLAHWGALVHPWLKLVNDIVVPSTYLQQVFASHGYQARVIHNTVDTSRFQYRVRTPLRPRLLSARNLESLYGVEHTLVAFSMVKAAYPDATLTIAGIGSQEDALRRLTMALKLTDVQFLGRVEPSAMPTLYDRADVLLNSSYIDNQPLSILEAMATGIPIVTTGVGDIANMLQHGVSGTLVPVGDPAAMAKAVIALLERPERALLMAHRAKQALEQYTWPQVRARWAHIYGQLAPTAGMAHAA